MSLTHKQISGIKSHLDRSGIKSASLYDDILDHYCCKIEELLEKESCTISRAIELAEVSICPEGAFQIEKELNYLLIINRNIMLHKIVFAIASFAGFIFLLSGTAWLANLLEGHVAVQFMGLSLIIAVFTVYPYLMYRLFKRSAQSLRKELA